MEKHVIYLAIFHNSQVNGGGYDPLILSGLRGENDRFGAISSFLAGFGRFFAVLDPQKWLFGIFPSDSA